MSPTRRINSSEYNGHFHTQTHTYTHVPSCEALFAHGYDILAGRRNPPPFRPTRSVFLRFFPRSSRCLGIINDRGNPRRRSLSRARSARGAIPHACTRAIRIFLSGADEWRLTGRAPECSCPVAGRDRNELRADGTLAGRGMI